MFSVEEKKLIAKKIEELLLELKHPEMPTEKPYFKIHIDGKEGWSWADIEPNWVFEEGKEMGVNDFNENSREIHEIKELVVEISNGNPGAIGVMMMFRGNPKWKDMLMWLKKNKIVGADLWVLYKDKFEKKEKDLEGYILSEMAKEN